MSQLIFIRLFILLSCTMTGSGVQEAVRGPQEPECGECHSDLLESDHLHYPAEDACDNCHEPTGETHPGENTGFRLMDDIPALCYYCHEEPIKQTSQHYPVVHGTCLDCHAVHGSSEASLLLRSDPDLCLHCHDRDYLTDSSRTTNIKGLVGGRMKAHSAIEGGGCMSCHLAHGSEIRELLVDTYPVKDYLPARTEAFGLCFLCHDTDLLEAEETEWGTGFRDGTRNLHRVHINGNKGRNCKMCHNIHGSAQPFLIEEKLGFGNWEMRMNFIPEEEGGSCLPGCHGLLSYKR